MRCVLDEFSQLLPLLFNVLIHFFDSCYDGAIGIFLRPTTTAGKERVCFRSGFMRPCLAYRLKRLTREPSSDGTAVYRRRFRFRR